MICLSERKKFKEVYEEYFTALGEPDKRYVEVEDSTYDYLAELKEEYGLSD